MSRERETVSTSLRAKRSNPSIHESRCCDMDCFASLAMTWRGHGFNLVGWAKEAKRRAHHPSTNSPQDGALAEPVIRRAFARPGGSASPRRRWLIADVAMNGDKLQSTSDKTHASSYHRGQLIELQFYAAPISPFEMRIAAAYSSYFCLRA